MNPAIVAIYFFLLLLPQTIFRKIALAAFLVVVAPGSALFPNFVGHKWGNGKPAWILCYLRTKDIEYCDQATGFPIQPNPDPSGLKEN